MRVCDDVSSNISSERRDDPNSVLLRVKPRFLSAGTRRFLKISSFAIDPGKYDFSDELKYFTTIGSDIVVGNEGSTTDGMAPSKTVE